MNTFHSIMYLKHDVHEFPKLEKRYNVIKRMQSISNAQAVSENTDEHANAFRRQTKDNGVASTRFVWKKKISFKNETSYKSVVF